MALTPEQKEEIRIIVAETLGDFIEPCGTYGELRQGFERDRKAQAKAAREAAKEDAKPAAKK